MKKPSTTKASVKTPSRTLTQLGSVSVSQFMAEYWHRKPLLVRQAFADFKSPVSMSLVLDHAISDDSEARLIEKRANKTVGKRPEWRLTPGPLDALPALSVPGWTVLLQGADTQSNDLSLLLGQFRFIPDARLDDLMISVASDQGGVGPHLDSYDVFLLQAEGQRHWRWGKIKDTSLQPDQPVKLLQNFIGGEEAVLEPGDMLYLPPGWAHEGIAQGPCMTFSIGFRARTHAEIMSDVLGRVMDGLEHSPRAQERIKDTRRIAATKPAKLEDSELAGYVNWIESWKPKKAELEALIGQHLTEPRQSVEFELPERPMKAATFQKQALSKGLIVHEATKALYRGKQIFVNGDVFNSQSTVLRALFDQRDLSPQQLGTLVADPTPVDSPAVWSDLYQFYLLGWILLP